MGILLSLVFFFFSFALLVCFAALVCRVTFSDSDAKYARVVFTPGENWQGMEFNWQIVVDRGLLSTFSGLWRVTQLGRCRL